jgi:hypothetical protein
VYVVFKGLNDDKTIINIRSKKLIKQLRYDICLLNIKQKVMENENTIAAEEFNITPIAVKEFALNSAKMDAILQLQVEILAHIKGEDKTEMFARVNQNIKELTLEWYIQNSIKK